MSDPELDQLNEDLRHAKRKRNFWIAVLVVVVLSIIGSMNIGPKPKAGTPECNRALRNVRTVEDLHRACDY